MITTEEAKARLEALKDPQWRAATSKRIGELPARLRSVAKRFVAPERERGHWSTAEEVSERLAAARELDKLPGDKRAMVMTALHPGLGAALARWWAEAMDRPYQRGWERKAFRAPSAPSLTVEARAAGLAGLITVAGPYDADPVWLAIWAAHLDAHGPRFAVDPAVIGGILASAISLGDRVAGDTLAALMEVGNGEHPIGLMGRHVIVALLGADRREGWDYIERLLLAAQLQEGLRQSILEAADLGHPGAFDRMLDVVLEKKLLRFAATARAVGVWLGFAGSMEDIPLIEARARMLREYRASEESRVAGLGRDDPWDAYIALSAGGMRDVLATIAEAEQLATSPSPDLRAVAVAYAAAVDLNQGQPLLVTAIDDPDVRVAALAAYRLGTAGQKLPGTFDAITRLITRVPAKAHDEAGFGVQNAPITIGQAELARVLLHAIGTRSVKDLFPWLPIMDAWSRDVVAMMITRETHWGHHGPRPPELTPETRAVLIGMLSDRSTNVRATALKGLADSRLEPAEAPAIEALLTRAATDTRRGALTLLKSLPAAEARASAARLAASKDKRQRDAAAELLREIGGAEAAAATEAVTVPVPVENLYDTVRASTSATPPRRLRCKAADPRAAAILVALDEVAAARRDVPVLVTWWQGTEEKLLADVEYRMFPQPFRSPGRVVRRGQQGEEGLVPQAMLLGEVFRGWWAGRPGSLRSGDDGLDALRAHVLTQQLLSASWRRPAYPGLVLPAAADVLDATIRQLAGDPPNGIRHNAVLHHVTGWLLAEHLNAAVVDECLDALEATLARVPQKVLATRPEDTPGFYRNPNALPAGDWRHQVRQHSWHQLLDSFLSARPSAFTPAQVERWYRLMRWVQSPHPRAQWLMVDEDLLAVAHATGAASDDDVAAAFLFPASPLFKNLTRHWRAQFEERHPGLVPVADSVRDRLVAVELQRGDLPTPTSAATRNVSSVHGTRIVAQLLARLGDAQLTRGWDRGTDGRDHVLSHLIRGSFPAPGEGGPDLAAAAAAARVPQARLVDLALYAPQWAGAVEEALGWPGLADGVFWLHAHTKDQQWSVDRELRDSWTAQTGERTPLTAADLVEGAVDVEWFSRTYEVLGGERWTTLDKAAKHASGGTGHRRAQVFAEAMLGQADEDAVIARVNGKRNQDAARALGLLPLPTDPAGRQAAIQRRYAVLREFERGSKAFGAQRRASEGTAVRIGIENLARTAGYPDPLRFTWAAEAQEAGDLANGPVTVTVNEVTLTLSVDAEGTPDLAVGRGGRPLKSIPVTVKKHPDVTAVQARKAALVKQASRVRESLEAAMTAQDAFTPADFADLRRHPVVAPMLRQLVWADEDGTTQSLGPEFPSSPLRIAHPANLVADGSWVSWQERLFTAGQRQPFKQVFREYYARTPQEVAESPVSRRYTGHQLQPRQALALFSARGWIASQETGDAARAFHRHGLVARVTFTNGYLTAAEAELPTIDGMHFTRRGEWLAQPLGSVPDVVFSEAMRDVDLVVSVAHAGGVDPEATASTTQMRAALIRETARLMKLGNIEPAGDSHVVIKGRLGEYSLHLGSGTVHRRPGGAVCIVPVGSQHRGRLFLPFADDDPKTAEIVSKALLLARDHEIKDPSILEQLRS